MDKWVRLSPGLPLSNTILTNFPPHLRRAAPAWSAVLYSGYLANCDHYKPLLLYYWGRLAGGPGQAGGLLVVTDAETPVVGQQPLASRGGEEILQSVRVDGDLERLVHGADRLARRPRHGGGRHCRETPQLWNADVRQENCLDVEARSYPHEYRHTALCVPGCRSICRWSPAW